MEQEKIVVDDKMADLINQLKSSIATVIEASDFKEPTASNNNFIVNVLLHISADYFAFICAVNRIKDDAITETLENVSKQYAVMFRNALHTYRATPDLDKLSGTQ